jgi:hypothetical protein
MSQAAAAMAKDFPHSNHHMKKTFKIGGHVSWNSEAGQVSGKIIKVHTKDVDYKG